jgi:8-oxo-dGTP pyrophosphatase MutT (NUDIX family)
MSPFRLLRTTRIQFGALPFRRIQNGGLEILLVTTRGRGRWIIPKGWAVSGLEPYESAAREALEEAGLVGRIGKEAIGSFRYMKRLKSGLVANCVVEVFPLEVQQHKSRWLEQGQREIRWFSADEAADVITEPKLKDLVRQFANDNAREGGSPVIEPT